MSRVLYDLAWNVDERRKECLELHRQQTLLFSQMRVSFLRLNWDQQG
jgi:hypothetical protein